eukprot:CAMPEP_0170110748 /NCGR_PEP_ID=MMETSP0020_2-20130122/8060_1 /TAXON_ID=98059 /ORGANISM="Dinobryon sp., Strain UTEXLB2267" /LENGTH=80 /DNA_ID=CAMNT_0010336137 /DNA_START=62 /DNA_END=300 /DNA_ORIENTATION=+
MQMVQAEKAISAVDWALQPRWEAINGPNGSTRVGTGVSGAGESPEQLSPSAPGMFLAECLSRWRTTLPRPYIASLPESVR